MLFSLSDWTVYHSLIFDAHMMWPCSFLHLYVQSNFWKFLFPLFFDGGVFGRLSGFVGSREFSANRWHPINFVKYREELPIGAFASCLDLALLSLILGLLFQVFHWTDELQIGMPFTGGSSRLLQILTS